MALAVVTGGAGFLGSHLCDRLLAGDGDVLRPGRPPWTRMKLTWRDGGEALWNRTRERARARKPSRRP